MSIIEKDYYLNKPLNRICNKISNKIKSFKNLHSVGHSYAIPNSKAG